MNLDPKRFGLACGILWAITVFLLTVLSVYTGYGDSFLGVVASIYPGFHVTLGGSIIGLIYGFFCGFIGGYIFIWFYNKLAK